MIENKPKLKLYFLPLDIPGLWLISKTLALFEAQTKVFFIKIILKFLSL